MSSNEALPQPKSVEQFESELRDGIKIYSSSKELETILKSWNPEVNFEGSELVEVVTALVYNTITSVESCRINYYSDDKRPELLKEPKLEAIYKNPELQASLVHLKSIKTELDGISPLLELESDMKIEQLSLAKQAREALIQKQPNPIQRRAIKATNRFIEFETTKENQIPASIQTPELQLTPASVEDLDPNLARITKILDHLEVECDPTSLLSPDAAEEKPFGILVASANIKEELKNNPTTRRNYELLLALREIDLYLGLKNDELLKSQIEILSRVNLDTAGKFDQLLKLLEPNPSTTLVESSETQAYAITNPNNTIPKSSSLSIESNQAYQSSQKNNNKQITAFWNEINSSNLSLRILERLNQFNMPTRENVEDIITEYVSEWINQRDPQYLGIFDSLKTLQVRNVVQRYFGSTNYNQKLNISQELIDSILVNTIHYFVNKTHRIPDLVTKQKEFFEMVKNDNLSQQIFERLSRYNYGEISIEKIKDAVAMYFTNWIVASDPSYLGRSESTINFVNIRSIIDKEVQTTVFDTESIDKLLTQIVNYLVEIKDKIPASNSTQN